MNPKLSGYAQLHGEFNYNSTPLALPITQVVIHGKPSVRGTWASHRVKGWYLPPSINHYRRHHIYVTKTRREQDSDCVEFLPHNNPHPYNSSSEKNAIIAAHELAHALKNPAPPAPFYNIGDCKAVAIEKLPEIVSKVADNLHERADPPK